MADKMETRRAMLSQPMAGKSKAEIRETREKAIAALTSAGYSVVNTLFTDEWYTRRISAKAGKTRVGVGSNTQRLWRMA